MAKVKLSKLLPALESEDGVAKPVDVKEESAALGKAEVQQVNDDGSGKGDVAEAAYEVEVDGKDFTAIDEASKRQGEVIHKQLERLQETAVSVEAYLGVVRESKAMNASIGSGAASVIRHDLTSRYPKFFGKLVPSTEAFDADNGPAQTIRLERQLTAKLGEIKTSIGKTETKLAKLKK